MRGSKASRLKRPGDLRSTALSCIVYTCFVMGVILMVFQITSFVDVVHFRISIEEGPRLKDTSESISESIWNPFPLHNDTRAIDSMFDDMINDSEIITYSIANESGGEDLIEDLIEASGEEFVEAFDQEVAGDFKSSNIEVISTREPPHGFFNGTVMKLEQQISLPKKPTFKRYNSDKNFSPIFKALKNRGWAHNEQMKDFNVNMIFSKGAVPPLLKRGKEMLNSIGVSGCIGGSKILQLECRRNLANRSGCSYDTDLRLQPRQFRLDTKSECRQLLEFAGAVPDKLWLFKPSNTFHGSGIKVLNGLSEVQIQARNCQHPRNAIIMEYISSPATITNGHKFDLRSYLLVGSLDPQLVFYADGFIRRSETKYATASTKDRKAHITNIQGQDSKDHFLNFTDLGKELEKELGFEKDFISKIRDHMKRASVYVFKTTDTQKKSLSRFPGRWHIFGVDWMIDVNGTVHLLEGNGYPLVTNYPIEGLTPDLWEETVDLVLKIHTSPDDLGSSVTVRDKFAFGKWSLIYNELEDEWNKKHDKPHFNACAVN